MRQSLVFLALILMVQDFSAQNDFSPIRSAWFNGGNLDYISKGFIRSTATILKVNIGKPDGFYLPFYVNMGATADIINNDSHVNEILVSELLNRKGGFINGGLEGHNTLIKLDANTYLNLEYQLAFKSLSGTTLDINSEEQFLSWMNNLGFSINTISWTDDQPDLKGRAWIKCFLSTSVNKPATMKILFDDCITPWLLSASIEGGINLKGITDLHFAFYKFLNNQHLENFKPAMYSLTAKFLLDKSTTD